MLIFQPVNAQFNFQGLETAIASANKELGKEFVIMVYKDGKIIFSKCNAENI